MVISYKEWFPWKEPTNFEARILAGTKIHTIRKDSTDRWHRVRGGRLLMHHSVRVRSPQQHCFLVNECTGFQDFQIYHHIEPHLTKVHVYIDSVRIDESPEQMIALIKNDGFDSIEDFYRFFPEDFDGKILHWTEFRYKPKDPDIYEVNRPEFSKNDLQTILSNPNYEHFRSKSELQND